MIGPTDFFNLHGAKYTAHTSRLGGMREAIKSPFGSGPFWVPRVAASAQGLKIKPPLQGEHDFRKSRSWAALGPLLGHS